MAARGPGALSPMGAMVCVPSNAPAGGRFFPPAVAVSVVTWAGERPDVVGRSLAPWESVAWARPWVPDGVVEPRSPQTVQRMVAPPTLKPWRHHRGRSPEVPREAACAAQGQALVTWYPRPLGVWARGLCVAEHTRLQPRTRPAPTLAAQPGPPVRVAPADARQGARHLCAGFEPRTGQVYATPAERKRQAACIAFWAPVAREMAPALTRMHGGLAPLRRHKGKPEPAGLTKHPRWVLVCPPGHGSWMHQVEHWGAILQRPRLRRAEVADKQQLAERWLAFVAEGHEHAHPWPWSTQSVAQVMAKCASTMAKAA